MKDNETKDFNELVDIDLDVKNHLDKFPNNTTDCMFYIRGRSEEVGDDIKCDATIKMCGEGKPLIYAFVTNIMKNPELAGLFMEVLARYFEEKGMSDEASAKLIKLTK